MAGAFQQTAFQGPVNEAFQMGGAAPPVTPPRRHGGKPLRAAGVTGPAGRRRKRVVMSAAFTAPQPRWRAVLDYNDDDLALAFLLESD